MALVITVIVLLVLAGVTLSLALGDNGVVVRAKYANEQAYVAKYKEEIEFVKADTKAKYGPDTTLLKLQWELDSPSREDWVEITDMITESGVEKIELITKDGFMFHITDEENKYIGNVDKNEATQVTITATPESRTTENVMKQEVSLLVNSVKGWKEWSGKYYWNTSATEEPSEDDWKSLTLDDKSRKEKTASVQKTANESGDYYLWVQINTCGKKVTKQFGPYKLEPVPTEEDIICTLKSKTDNDTKGVLEVGSTKSFNGWKISYIKNNGAEIEITQGQTTDINVVRNDYIEVIYSKPGQTDVIKTLTLTELKSAFQLVYNATGGTNSPETQTGYSNTDSFTFTVTSSRPTKTGYSFTEWRTTADTTGTVYNAGDTITSTSPTFTLYAQWEEKWVFKENTKEPTCTETGIDVYELEGTETTKEVEIPALGHTESAEWAFSSTGHYHSCARCGIQFTAVEPHTSSGNCTICGYTGTFNVSFNLFKMTSSNTTATASYGTSYSTTLTPINSLSYKRPDSVSISMGGQTITSGYTYNNVSGALTINNITGNLVITASAVNYNENISFTNAKEATLGASETVELMQSYQLRVLAFTPTTSGNYRFYSNDSVASTRATDPYAYLYDTSTKTLDELDEMALQYAQTGSTSNLTGYLANNDDGGDGYNFSITYNCTAGRTYYLAIRTYSPDKIQSFSNVYIVKQ